MNNMETIWTKASRCSLLIAFIISMYLLIQLMNDGLGEPYLLIFTSSGENLLRKYQDTTPESSNNTKFFEEKQKDAPKCKDKRKGKSSAREANDIDCDEDDKHNENVYDKNNVKMKIIKMDKYEKYVFDDGKDVEGYLQFYNITDFYSSTLPGDNFIPSPFSSLRSKCNKMTFKFPHVPKTGGRSIAFTFNDDRSKWGRKHTRVHRILNDTAKTSRKSIMFSTSRQHHYLPEVAMRSIWYGDEEENEEENDDDGDGEEEEGNEDGQRDAGKDDNKKAKDVKYEDDYKPEVHFSNDEEKKFFEERCLGSSINPEDIVHCSRIASGECSAWIFLLREPISRLVSAFYTSTGRGGHFTCKDGTSESEVLSNAESQLSDWLKFPLESRKENCDVFNFHARYLASDFEEMTPKQYLMLARNRLLQMDWFGLTSRFEESIAMLSHLTQTDIIRYQPIFNYNPHVNTISDKIRDQMSEGQEVDILLYRLAEKVFDYRWKLMLQTLGKRKPSQVFKCDKKTECYSPHFHMKWLIDQKPPESFYSLSLISQRVSLCVPPNGCSRHEVW